MDADSHNHRNLLVLGSETNQYFWFQLVAGLLLCFQIGFLLVLGLIEPSVFASGEDRLSSEWAIFVGEAAPTTMQLPTDRQYTDQDLIQIVADAHRLIEHDLHNEGIILRVALVEVVAIIVPAIFLFLSAWIAYRRYPARIQKAQKLRLLDASDQPVVYSTISDAISRAGMITSPTILADNDANDTSAQVFGTGTSTFIKIGLGARYLLGKRPSEFRAIVLHELAHIKNKDIPETYFSLALFYSTIFVLIVPFSLYMAWVMFNTRSSLFVFVIQLVLPTFATLSVFTFATRGLLRARETYADWRAALWGAQSELVEVLRNVPASAQSGLVRLLRLYPDNNTRLENLRQPGRLLRINPAAAMLTGLLAGYMFSALEVFKQIANAFIVVLPLEVYGRLILATVDLYQTLGLGIIPMVNGLYVVNAFVAGPLTWMLEAVYWAAPAIFIAATLGLQIQRKTLFGERSSGPSSFKESVAVAALMAIGIELAYLTGIGHVYYLRATDFFPSIILSPLVATLILLIWIQSMKWLSKLYLGTYNGTSLSVRSRRLITAVSAIWLLVLYAPFQYGRLMLVEQENAATVNSFVLIAVTSIVLGIILAILMFGVAFTRLAYRLVIHKRCKQCGHPIKHVFVLGKTCEHCGAALDLWTYS